ncbi:MAG: F0F1 ATP synthase subunit B [Clostridia bacterium]|nr:F0F1 ATP synthase subunit B [Clostridia bacterium]MBQ4322744.1 F0F1 ATP synthase subunit B [Clostridia bacterium]
MLAIQTLDIVSVNLWQILISLVNLLLIFLIVKKFLFKPVQRMLDQRQQEVDSRYAAADEAKAAAEADRQAWAETVKGAKDEADRIIKNAEANAESRKEDILSDANRKADGILRRAESEAELERRKAAEEIKKEIVDVSSALAEKMLEREIRQEDHRALIDSFIDEVGDDHGRTE